MSLNCSYIGAEVLFSSLTVSTMPNPAIQDKNPLTDGLVAIAMAATPTHRYIVACGQTNQVEVRDGAFGIGYGRVDALSCIIIELYLVRHVYTCYHIISNLFRRACTSYYISSKKGSGLCEFLLHFSNICCLFVNSFCIPWQVLIFHSSTFIAFS